MNRNRDSGTTGSRRTQWKEAAFQKLATRIRRPYEPSESEDLPYVGLGHIGEGTLSLEDVGVSSDTKSTKNRFKAGDILFGSLRSYLRKVVRPNLAGVCSTDITVLRSTDVVDQSFLFYLVGSPLFIQVATKSSSGTRMPRVQWDAVDQTKWPLPPLPTQRKIAAILSAYDNLIENNTRRIAILEEMARLLYREWFVRFNFPGYENVEMVDSELGLIPEGWEVQKLEEVCRLTLGQSPPSKYYNETGEGLPFHQGVTDFGRFFPHTTRYCTVTKRTAQHGDILFSVRAPVGRLNIADRRLVIGRGLHALRSKIDLQSFLFFQLRNRFAHDDTMGSGTIFKSVTKADMLGIKLLHPSSSLSRRFEAIASNILRLIMIWTDTNRRLHQARDLLLPRLVSGQLDVSELDVDTEVLA